MCIYYLQRAVAFKRFLKTDDILAHWTYTEDEWRRYSELEFREDKKHSGQRIYFKLYTLFQQEFL